MEKATAAPVPATPGANALKNTIAPKPAMSWRRETFSRLLANPIATIALIILLLLVLGAILAPWLATHDPFKMDFKTRFGGPSAAHWLGTDEAGRDLYSRILWGARISLFVAFASVMLSLVIGLPWGIIAAYRGGILDDVLMRICDAMMAFPGLLFALLIIVALGPSIQNLILTIGILSAPAYARIIRSAVLGEREHEYVIAAIATGVKGPRVAVRHILPNCSAPLIVQISLGAASAILIEATLSFLGLGVQPPEASWASLLKQGYGYMGHSLWYVFFPGVVIFLVVWSLNTLGDGLRDALDPRLRTTQRR